MAIPNYKLFQSGNRFFTASAKPATGEEDSVTLDPMEIGTVHLPTGRVIIDDPLFMMQGYQHPFTRTVPPGVYPVFLAQLSVRHVYQGEVNWYSTNAALMVRIADGEPVTWEMAVTEGQDPATLGPHEFFGYGVDSGVAGIFSPEALELLYANDDDDGGLLKDCGRSGQERFVLPETDLDVVMCLAGEGDGSYASYWGLDKDGAVVCLATDFALLYNPDRQ